MNNLYVKRLARSYFFIKTIKEFCKKNSLKNWQLMNNLCITFLLKRQFKNDSPRRIRHEKINSINVFFENGRFPSSFLFELIYYAYV